MRIELDAGGRKPRRWQIELARRLEAAGHRLTVARRPPRDAEGESAGLSLLVTLESRLYRVKRPLRCEAAAWPAGIAASAGECDLAIDFAGDALAAEVTAPTLVPLYDGVPGEAAAVHALLDGRAPLLAVAMRAPGEGAARIVATALPALEERPIFAASLERVLFHMERLVARSVERFATGRLEAAEPAPAASPSPMPGVARAGLSLANSLAARVANRLTARHLHREHWRIGWRRPAGDGIAARLALPQAPFSFLPDDAARYYADPFVFRHAGTAYLFCEEYPYATWKGVISVSTIGEDGKASVPRIVLERPYHLSYPMVFEREGAIFMIPETSANRSVELYRALRFPDEWRLEAVLMEGLSAADATLVERDGRLWLFAAIAEEGASSWDTLGLFHAGRLTGPWTPHAANPVLVDARAARPAGMMIERGGELIRPAQDCTGGYGSALTLCRVDRLDPEHYAQTVVARLTAPPGTGFGMHTLNEAGGIEVIDCVGPRRRR